LEREIARARRDEQPLVLAFVDVDGLKAINDARGHAGGDRMLLAVANAFRVRLRSHDLIIRYGVTSSSARSRVWRWPRRQSGSRSSTRT